MDRDDDPITDGLKKVGLHVEPREASVFKQMLGSGLGGIIGSAIGGALGMGALGRGLWSLAGSLAGHAAVTHRVTYEPRREGEQKFGFSGGESPASWSDRR